MFDPFDALQLGIRPTSLGETELQAVSQQIKIRGQGEEQRHKAVMSPLFWKLTHDHSAQGLPV